MHQPMPRRPRRPVSKRFPKLFVAAGRALLFVLFGVVLASVSVYLFHRTESRNRQQRLEARKKLDVARNAQLREAVDGWAMQEVIRLYAANATRRPGTPDIPVQKLDDVRKSARETFDLSDDPEPAPVAPLPNYWAADGTKLSAFVDGLLEKAGVASAIAAALLFLAAILVPVYSLCTGAAAGVLNRLTEVNSARAEGGGGVSTGVMAMASAVAVGNDGMVARRLALGAAAVGAAAVIIGTMTLHIPGSEYELPVDRQGGRAVLSIDDLKLNVKPGTIDVPAQNITAHSPALDATVAPIQFNFPALTAQQEVLTILTHELAAYREMIEHQTIRDQEILRLVRENATLATQNQGLQSTAEQERSLRTALQAQLTDRTTLLAGMQRHLQGLTNSQNHLVVSQKNLAIGSTLDAVRYARQLNAQNDRLFNQLFRRGVIRENCRVFAQLGSTFDSLKGEDCIQYGWKHAFVDLPKQKALHLWDIVTSDAKSDSDEAKSPPEPPALPILQPPTVIKTETEMASGN